MDARTNSKDTSAVLSAQEAETLLKTPKAVYVKKMTVAELKLEPELIGKLDMLEPHNILYSVHLGDGKRVALLDDRDAAFHGARQYEMEPHSVH